MQKTQNGKMFNRAFGVILVAALALTFALAGCASNNQSSSNSSSASTAQKAPETITVTMTATDLEGNTLCDETVKVEPGSNVFNVLENSGVDYVSKDGDYGAYVVSIAGVESGSNTGWIFTQNGESVAVGADQQEVADGDTIAWEFIEF